MYVNLTVWKNSGLLSSDLIFLAAISQKETEYLIENLTEEDYERFKALSLTEHIKSQKKGEHVYNSLRLSKRGKEFISELEEAPVLEEDQKVADWLINHYRQLDKEIGNKKKLVRHIKDFRIKSNIEKNNLIKLVLDFLSEHEDRSRVLEYIWYYPKTAFETRFQLEESWLYKHYLKREDYFKSIFEEY